ncbi:ribonuclease T2 family protein [Crocosphaera sp. XPORK-15E]|uniref:ribonuclease T2 family protein n=1 Tax=Crocosphaera sp. XPORK-15E TaxID=3110247 RepID=UPI002B214EDF|nr:hypothetical protein [Crocosphaera sp. XPORK-15E]MEA5535471.1 hypothetical protein [Crocosphaera sp. XPORK-15E]
MKILKTGLFLITIIVFYITLWISPASASVKLDGKFTAQESCAALQSIRKGTNPGNIFIKPQETYQVLAKNKDDASHYQIKIDGVEPSLRWVAIDCGTLADAPLPDDNSTNNGSSNKDYLLALSWQPAFCETRPNKPECLTKDTDTFEATHFVLHGLWPQPNGNFYCGVSRDIKKLDKPETWDKMPPIKLSEKTWDELKIKMPGVASSLHLHEWYKHGTCYSESPEEYFQESLALLDQVNNSEVRDLFVSNLGKELNTFEIRKPFDVKFGTGSGTKVDVKCGKDQDESQQVITEVWINLKGEIERNTSIKDLLEKSPSTFPSNCRGEIDPAPVNEA